MIGQGYIALERILDEINMDFKFLSAEVDWQDLLVWMGKFVGLIGAPKLYLDKTTGVHPLTPHITVTDHKGDLPTDFVNILPGGVRDAITHEVYVHGTDSFMDSYHKSQLTQNETDETLAVEQPVTYVDSKTYTINDYKITTSEDEATLELAYKAFITDDRGFPMIPDNERILEGCKYFIAEKVAFNMWGAKQLDDKVYQKIEQHRDFYVGSAQAKAVQMTPEEMESFTRAWVRLNPVLHHHQYSFRFTGVREDLNIGSNHFIGSRGTRH